MVVSADRVRRREPCAISCGSPIARSTWDGSRDPEVHAEPLEPQMPSMSSMISMDSPSMNWNAKFALLESLWDGCPLRRANGISFNTRSIRWSRIAFSFAVRSSIVAIAISTALPNPTIPAVFSVPPRRLRSCAPPWMKERVFNPVRI